VGRRRNPWEDAEIARGLVGLAQRARGLRLALGLTLEETAERSDLDVRHVQLIEAGTGNPTLATLMRLARGLEVDVDVLVVERRTASHDRVSERTVAYQTRRSEEWAESDAVVAMRVKSLRLARDWAQAELASRAGLSQGAIQAIEARTKSPTLRTLDAIAQAFGLTPDALLRPEREVRMPKARAGRS
jgi:transcriptional regulator with XRE-family HTH domain